MGDDLMVERFPPRKRPSIYDVAKLAGVSHMTVSRVLNGAPHIKEETRLRVQEAIDITRYRPSSAARSLATNRSKRLGLLVDSPEEYGPAQITRSIEAAARAHGYSLSIYTHTEAAGGDLEAGIVELEQLGIDALCVIGVRASTESAVLARKGKDPVVIAGTGLRDATSIDAERGVGAVAATQHLFNLGHRGIIHLSGPTESFDASLTEAAFREAAASAGVPVRVITGDWTPRSGYVLGSAPDPFEHSTAVFAASDKMALGVIHGLRSRGVDVPGDISVVGFDDAPGAAHFLPPLTTVRLDLARAGEKIVESALSAMAHVPYAAAPVSVELVVRASTAPPRTASS